MGATARVLRYQRSLERVAHPPTPVTPSRQTGIQVYYRDNSAYIRSAASIGFP